MLVLTLTQCSTLCLGRGHRKRDGQIAPTMTGLIVLHLLVVYHMKTTGLNEKLGFNVLPGAVLDSKKVLQVFSGTPD